MSEVKIHPKKLVHLLAVIVVGLALLNVASYIPLIQGTRDAPIHMLNLDSEQNLPSLFSTALLGLCAMLTGGIAWASTAVKGRRLQWGGLSATFLFLSIDESVSLHERLGGLVDKMLSSWGLLTFSWTIPYAILLVVFVAVYGNFLLKLPSDTKKWVIIAAALYVSGGLGCEILGGIWYLKHDLGFVYYVILACEEILEMSGCVAFIYAFSNHIDKHLPAFRLGFASS